MYAAKAIVALLLGFLAPFGITGEMTVEEFFLYMLSAIITAAGVYFIPNRK